MSHKPIKDNGIYKNIIVCCDGTGKAASHGKIDVPTNVFRFAQALRVAPDSLSPEGVVRETEQVVLYQAGVGTDASLSSASNFIGGECSFQCCSASRFVV